MLIEIFSFAANIYCKPSYTSTTTKLIFHWFPSLTRITQILSSELMLTYLFLPNSIFMGADVTFSQDWICWSVTEFCVSETILVHRNVLKKPWKDNNEFLRLNSVSILQINTYAHSVITCNINTTNVWPGIFQFFKLFLQNMIMLQCDFPLSVCHTIPFFRLTTLGI